MQRFSVIILSVLCTVCVGYQTFQRLIPNGERVPHPCRPGVTWEGVGHLSSGGRGRRNPFGVDFNRNKKRWDRCLCEADSDGDGLSNGEELGDPDCVWEYGGVPSRAGNLSHPGVCEPLGSPECVARNQDLTDLCDHTVPTPACIRDLQADDSVVAWPVVLPTTVIPNRRSTYMCQVFAAPDITADFHVVGFEPSIDNHEFFNHAVVFGCNDDSLAVDAGPQECGMPPEACWDPLFSWTLGQTGRCLEESFGFRVGRTGYKRVMIQVHWSNPEYRMFQEDGSGFTVYLTSNLRPNDGGVLLIGQRHFEIPGNKEDVGIGGRCSSQCTDSLVSPIYIAESSIHMHAIGTKGYIEHMRNGTVINQLMKQEDSLDVSYILSPSVELLPGDELRVVCHYDSTSRGDVTYYGESTTSSEMCYGMLSYYPAIPEFTGCLEFGSTPLCTRNISDVITRNTEFDGCYFGAFINRTQEIFYEIITRCDATGQTCYPACDTYMTSLRQTDPCFTGDAYQLLNEILLKYYSAVGQALINYLRSCELSPDINMTEIDTEEDSSEASGSGGSEGATSVEENEEYFPLCPVTEAPAFFVTTGKTGDTIASSGITPWYTSSTYRVLVSILICYRMMVEWMN